ncbi:hypothetical protein ZTR_06512 [Talaromyces verruculosus]|nr:hypothetical protein ZTR_06512 [Talaromyces verruculosus]
MGRKLRILGLHGYGTSGAIFSSQTCNYSTSNRDLTISNHINTASFRRFLQQQHDQTGDGDIFDFEFANGFLDSGPAAGIELFYNPPYYAWWPSDPSLEDMTKARERLKLHVKQNGPYDGVIMFSQGCTLGASLLLEHYKDTPQDPPPFQFAIFICGGPSLKQLEAEFGFTIDPELWEVDAASRQALARRADTAAILAQGSDRWSNDVNDITDYSTKELVQMVRGPYQIKIPTVHIVGSKDPRNLAGHQLHAISHPDITRIYEHGGGHDIPRNETTSTTIARLVRWVSSSITAEKAKQINGI